MAHIDNLKERLLNDAGTKAASIENEARAKADEVVKGAAHRAQAIAESNRSKAEKDGKERYERMLSRAQLDIRNKALEAKQQSIENVLKLAIERVKSLSDEDYMGFMQKLLENSTETGEEEVVFSIKDRARVSLGFIDKVNASLSSKGRKGMLRLSTETANIPSGFLLRRGGLETNCSIESILKVLREDLEGELSRLLFEKQD